MSDTLERRLRETLERRVLEAGPPPPVAPQHVLKRAHRRQARTVLAATAAVAALSIGSLAGIRALTGRGGQSVPGNVGPTKTSTVRGVTLTYPADWYLEPFGTGYTPQTAVDFPLFALANYTPSVPFAAAPAVPLCTPTGVVMAVQEEFGVAPGPAPAPSQWPVALAPITDGLDPAGCAQGFAASWAASGRRFHARVYAGPDGSTDDLQAMFAAYASMTFGPGGGGSETPGPGGTHAVIASGNTEAAAWTLSASESGGGLSLSFDSPGGGSGTGAAAAGGGAPPAFVGTAVIGNTVFVYGFVSSRVTGVEGSLSCCPPPVRGAIYPLPARFTMKGDVVLVQIPLATAGGAPQAGPGTLVAYDRKGNVVVRKRFTYLPRAAVGGPTPFPDPIATLTAQATATP